ncbi:MAG: DUF4132 domain-containing protein [bacterium]|nr:DUF4132 domain-containing protein [bacterium]
MKSNHEYFPFPIEISTRFKQLAANYNREWLVAHKGPKKMTEGPLSCANIEEIVSLMQQVTIDARGWQRFNYVPLHQRAPLDKMITLFLETPGLQLIHAVRFLLLMGFLVYFPPRNSFTINTDFRRYLTYYRITHKKTFQLREVTEALEATGLNREFTGSAVLMQLSTTIPFMWETDSVWPFYKEHTGLLKKILEPWPKNITVSNRERDDVRRKAFFILDLFPEIPEDSIDWLLDLALEAPGKRNTLSGHVRKRLKREPWLISRLIETLKDKSSARRAAAASWLAEIRTAAAIPHLKKSLHNEKNNAVRGAKMNALEMSGVPLKEFLDRKNLATKAAGFLKKGIPGKPNWFPFHQLPEVHWLDGEKVEKEIVIYLLFQGYGLKELAPATEVRLYFRLMEREQRCELGRFVLRAWLKQGEAGLRQGEGAKEVLKAKGLLAPVPVCLDAESVTAIETYLNRWHGKRAAQCRILVQLLTWAEYPLAIQLLLSAADNYPTKNVRREAELSVENLAARKGWTHAELEDRTVPMAGLNQWGQMVLDYGSREFVCSLDKNLKWQIETREGKRLRALPKPAEGDDRAKVKAARKQLKESKKVLKSLLVKQEERLYQSMCMGREWRFEDWRLYLANHPVVSVFCKRLVWEVIGKKGKRVTFKPAGGGTLVDAEGKEVAVDKNASIRLPHTAVVSNDVAGTWQEHFKKKENVNLFPQFPGDYFLPEEGDKELTGVDFFQGYMMDNMVLRNALRTLGYAMGAMEDERLVFTYVKEFSRMGIQVAIETSGSELTAGRHPVAIARFYFRKLIGESSRGFGLTVHAPKIQLKQVPPILLSETWSAIKEVTAKGTGYDPAWRDKITRA